MVISVFEVVLMQQGARRGDAGECSARVAKEAALGQLAVGRVRSPGFGRSGEELLGYVTPMPRIDDATEQRGRRMCKVPATY